MGSKSTGQPTYYTGENPEEIQAYETRPSKAVR
jgi:hypothetical protein